MPARRTANIDWTPWDARIFDMFGRGLPVKDIWKLLCAEGMDVKLSTFHNHVITRLKLYRNGPYGPRINYVEVRPVRKPAEGRALGWRELGLMDEEPREPRLCQRPTLGKPASLTAALMGDPRPGRVPWVA